jgi:hypothetical protein
MNYILFDDKTWNEFLPLTYTRPVAEIRIGILTIRGKWEKYLKEESISYFTQPHLQAKYPMVLNADNMFINGSLIPTAELLSEIDTLETGQVLVYDNMVCAARFDAEQAKTFSPETCCHGNTVQTISECIRISHLWDIFKLNGDAIEHDFRIITKGRKSAPISNTNTVTGDNEVFIERGAVVECCTLNTKNGPIYIGRNTEVMEHSSINIWPYYHWPAFKSWG